MLLGQVGLVKLEGVEGVTNVESVQQLMESVSLSLVSGPLYFVLTE